MVANHIVVFGVLISIVIGAICAVKATTKRARAKLTLREELIATWRRELLPLDRDAVYLPTSSGGFAFMHTSAYASLRPYLSGAFRDHVEAEPQIIQFIIDEGRIVGIAGDYPYKQMAAEISRIKGEWGLSCME